MLLYSISLALFVSLVACSCNMDNYLQRENGQSGSTGHINSKRSKRVISSKLKHTQVRNSNIHKRNRIRAVPASYIQTTTVEAIDFIPENLHLNRHQVPLEESHHQKNLMLGIGLGVIFLLFLISIFMCVRNYKSSMKNASLHRVENPSNEVFPNSVQKPEPVLDSDHNVQTKWRINSFLGVVSSVVDKLPKTRSMVSSVGHMPASVNPQQRQY